MEGQKVNEINHLRVRVAESQRANLPSLTTELTKKLRAVEDALLADSIKDQTEKDNNLEKTEKRLKTEEEELAIMRSVMLIGNFAERLQKFDEITLKVEIITKIEAQISKIKSRKAINDQRGLKRAMDDEYSEAVAAKDIKTARQILAASHMVENTTSQLLLNSENIEQYLTRCVRGKNAPGITYQCLFEIGNNNICGVTNNIKDNMLAHIKRVHF